MREWRSGLADVRDSARFLPVGVFDAVGEHDLAEKLDTLALADNFYGGISAALPRMAKRALAKGDKARPASWRTEPRCPTAP